MIVLLRADLLVERIIHIPGWKLSRETPQALLNLHIFLKGNTNLAL